jgi:hypothetical protein
MGLADKQRESLISERGEPTLRLEFDVFADGHISMWTHFQHGENFGEAKHRLIAIHQHLGEFINDESLCPFHKAAGEEKWTNDKV